MKARVLFLVTTTKAFRISCQSNYFLKYEYVTTVVMRAIVDYKTAQKPLSVWKFKEPFFIMMFY